MIVVRFALLVVEAVNDDQPLSRVIALVVTGLLVTLPVLIAAVAFWVSARQSAIILTLAGVWSVMQVTQAFDWVLFAALVFVVSLVLAVWWPTSRRYARAVQADRENRRAQAPGAS